MDFSILNTNILQQLKVYNQLEECIFSATTDKINEAKEIYEKNKEFVSEKYIFHLIIYAASVRCFKFEQLSDLWQYFGQNSLIFEKTYFTDFLFKRGIIKEEQLKVTNIKKKKGKSDYEYPFPEKTLASYIKDDNIEAIKEYSLDNNLGRKYVFVEKNRLLATSFAAFCGSNKVLKFLMEKNCPITKETLEYAIKGGNLEAVKVLSARGIKIYKCLTIAIKWHQNEVADWIINNTRCKTAKLHHCILSHNTAAFSCLSEIYKALNRNVSLMFNIHTLVSACKNGQLEYAKIMVESGVNVNDKDLDRLTPLIAALNNEHLDVAHYLLTKGAKINLTFDKNETPASYAIKHSTYPTIKFIFDNGADILWKDFSEKSYLSLAVESQSKEAVDYLVHKGLNINYRDRDGLSPLALACKAGNYEIVSYLLENGAEVESYDNERITPVLHAILLSKESIACKLIEYGANLTIGDNYRRIPIIVASSLGLTSVIKLCIEKGIFDANYKNEYNVSLLHAAAESCMYDTVKYLLDHGACVDARTTSLYTPLSRAVIKGDEQLIDLLLSRGSDIEAVDKFGCTPLITAIARGNKEAVKFLIKRKANTKAKTKHGSSCMHCALRENNEVLSILASEGVSTEDVNNDGETPLILATRKGSIDCIEELIKCKANVDAKNRDGYTCAMIALLKGNLKVMDMMLDNGANLEEKDKNGRTLLFIAITKSMKQTMVELIKRGANIETTDNEGDTPFIWSVKNNNILGYVNLKRFKANIHAKTKEGKEAIDYIVPNSFIAKDFAKLISKK